MPGSGTALLIVAAAVLVAAVAAFLVRFSRFRDAVRTAFESTPDIRVTAYTPTGMAVTVAGYPLTVDFLRLSLSRATSAPAALAILANGLRRSIPPMSIPPLGLVRDRILPMLKRDDTLPPVTGYVVENRVLRMPFDGDVIIAYVIEGQFRVTYVTEGMQHAWGLVPDALHGLALANLRGKTEHLLGEIGGPREDYVALDGFDATRLLVADLLIPPGIADPVLAIPHEHALLIRSRSASAALTEEVTRTSTNSSLPLSDHLYRWSSSGPVRAELDQSSGREKKFISFSATDGCLVI